MKAIVKQVDGLTFVGKGDTNHWVPMDTEVSLKGADAGTKPMELLLIGLGGCTGMDVAYVLDKKRVKVDDFWVEIEAKRADEHPKVFTSIRLKYVFVGQDIPRDAVEKAIELSETKYCSATAMLQQSTEIATDYEIRKSRD